MEKARQGDRDGGQERAGTTSAFAERLTGGSYLNIEPDRAQLARYGLSVARLLEVIGTALGGEMVTTTVEGRERFGVSVRYRANCAPTPSRSSAKCWFRSWAAPWCPLGQVAKVVVARGTPGIPHRERIAVGVHLRRHPWSRHRSYVADARKRLPNA
jgi:Cu(I)/Ag(I) efflux system membrane protein CusA/SilA